MLWNKHFHHGLEFCSYGAFILWVVTIRTLTHYHRQQRRPTEPIGKLKLSVVLALQPYQIYYSLCFSA